MSDWSFPSLAQTWANFVAAIKGRDESNAKMDYTGDSNIPDGTVRWSAANNRFEVWDATGLAWSALSTQYLINVDTVDSEHAADFASAVGGAGSRQAKDADTVDGVDLPGTIAQVLTNHTKAVHDALNIDAETLDGLNSTQFLRSDTADAMNALLTLKDPAGNASNQQIDYTGGYQLYRDDTGSGTDNSRLWINTPDRGEVIIGPRSGAQRLNNVRIRVDVLQVDAGAGNKTVWHEGNVDSAPGLNSSKGTTGYVDLPGGLILQWGQISIASNSNANDSFAKTFPNACLQAVAAPNNSSSETVAAVFSFTTSTILLGNGGDSTATIRWMAIGH